MGRKKTETTVVVPLAEGGWTMKHLEDSLLSALRQGRRGVRLSVIDGTGSAHTRPFVEAVIRRERRRQAGLAEEALGPLPFSEELEYETVVGATSLPTCLYQALASVRSRWVAYLEPGVVWRNDHLFRLITMAERCKLDVAFSGSHVGFAEWSEIPATLRQSNVIDLSGALHSFAAYSRLSNGWRQNKMWSDLDLWLQFVTTGAAFGHDRQQTSVRHVPRAGVLEAMTKGEVIDVHVEFTIEDLERLGRYDDFIDIYEPPRVRA